MGDDKIALYMVIMAIIFFITIGVSGACVQIEHEHARYESIRECWKLQRTDCPRLGDH